MSEPKNYACCGKCRLFIPLHHPEAIAWVSKHTKECRRWAVVTPDRVIGAVQPLAALQGRGEVRTENAIVITASWVTRPDVVVYRSTPPEGFEVGVGQMEQLAYELPPVKRG
jgi:hypothetical protein